MKKTLIAIAALAATGAFAQSTVTIDGLVDAGYVSYNYKGVGVTGIDRNLTSTSQINFRVSSDLGGGLKATWRSETDFSPVSNPVNTGAVGNVGATTGVAPASGAGTTNGVASAFMNGEQILALTGGFGKVAFGAINNGALAAHGTSQPFGTAIGSGFRATSGSFVTPEVRADNSFQYVTPTLGGGFTVGAIVRKQQAVTGTNSAFSSATLGAQAQAGVTELTFAYNAGPLNALLVRATQDSTNMMTVTSGTGAVAFPTSAVKGTFTALAANYNMGAITVYGGYQLNKAAPFSGANNVDRQTVTVAAQYVAGVHTMMGSYQRASNNLTITAPATTSGSSLIGLGYEYALSKTAALTARYERIGDGANLVAITPFTAQNGATDRTRMGVGLRVGF
jgi:predicted porin